MKYIGGYSILDLTDANVSTQANVCYNQDKPVLVYGANGEKFFADTITKDGTNIVITKGGKTITIANDNTITNVGDIQNHLYYTNINATCEDDNHQCYFSITLNTNREIATLTSNELIELLNNYSDVVLIGFAEYDDTTYTEITFSINNNVITEIGFDNGSNSSNTITSIDNINVSSVKIF